MNLPPGVAFTPFSAPLSFGSRPEPRTVGGTHRFQHWAMACSWGIWVANQEFEYAAQAVQEVWDEVDRLENLLSRFLGSSDVTRVNAAAKTGEWTNISVDTWECLLLGLAMGEATGGAFDITLGATLEARRGDDDLIGQSASQPTREAWPGPGYKYLQIEDEPMRARLAHPTTQIDLGAIGKGFALDKAAQLLAEWGIENVLLYAGQSTVLARGNAPLENLTANTSEIAAEAAASTCSEGWPVELRDPRAEDSATPNGSAENSGVRNSGAGVVILKNAALSGSGQALHGYHIIDPRTGQAAPRGRATWAIAPSAALSDAASTAFMNGSDTEIEMFCQQQPQVSALRWDNGAWQHFGQSNWHLKPVEI